MQSVCQLNNIKITIVMCLVLNIQIFLKWKRKKKKKDFYGKSQSSNSATRFHTYPYGRKARRVQILSFF